MPLIVGNLSWFNTTQGSLCNLARCTVPWMLESYHFTIKEPLRSLLAAFTLRVIECCFVSSGCFLSWLVRFELTFLPKDSSPDPSPCTRRVVPWYDSMKSYSLHACQLASSGVYCPGVLRYPIKQYSQLPTSTWRSGHLNCGYASSGTVSGRLIPPSSARRSQCSKQGSRWELSGRSQGACEPQDDAYRLVDG